MSKNEVAIGLFVLDLTRKFGNENEVGGQNESNALVLLQFGGKGS